MYLLYRWHNCTAADLPLKVPITVTPTVSVNDALHLLNEEFFDQVPVVDDKGFACDVDVLILTCNEVILYFSSIVKLCVSTV